MLLASIDYLDAAVHANLMRQTVELLFHACFPITNPGGSTCGEAEKCLLVDILKGKKPVVVAVLQQDPSVLKSVCHVRSQAFLQRENTAKALENTADAPNDAAKAPESAAKASEPL